MAQYRIVKKDGSAVLVEAEWFEKDGSGLRLYNAYDKMVASYNDGSFTSCEPADVTVEAAPPSDVE
jgi:hypothetical protein